jgi:hypothetical protein
VGLRAIYSVPENADFSASSADDAGCSSVFGTAEEHHGQPTKPYRMWAPRCTRTGYGLFYGGGGELLGCQVRLVRYLCPLPAT